MKAHAIQPIFTTTHITQSSLHIIPIYLAGKSIFPTPTASDDIHLKSIIKITMSLVTQFFTTIQPKS